MNKKEYIEKMASLIVNRVKFHAPKVKNEEVDFELLEVVGIDPKLPLFKYDKPLDGNFYHAFLQAKEKIKFNLILTQKPLISEKKALDRKSVV